MRNILFLIVAFLFLRCEAQTTILPIINHQKGIRPDTYNAFVQSVPVPYVSNPISVHTLPYANTCPGGIMIDPLDSTKKIFWRGEFIGGSSVNSQIALYTGSDANDPFDIGTRYGVVLSGSESYDISGCRFGWPVLMGDTAIWYYYVGVDASFDWRICRASSTDGGRTYTKRGVVLDFNGIDEFSLSGPSIYIENGIWYMNYTAWSGVPAPNNDPGHPTVGIKLATSNDGITWTSTGTFLVTMGTFNRVEDATFYKIGNRYCLIYNAFTEGNYGIFLASNTVLNTTFSKIKPILWYRDLVHVLGFYAVGFLYYISDGSLYMYYQEETILDTADDIFVSKMEPPY